MCYICISSQLIKGNIAAFMDTGYGFDKSIVDLLIVSVKASIAVEVITLLTLPHDNIMILRDLTLGTAHSGNI